jgi:3D (Asp-Asp-Asp) domain-containing protein
MMKKTGAQFYFRSFLWAAGAGLFLVSLVTGSMVSSRSESDRRARDVVHELHRLELLTQLSPKTVTDLIDYQWHSGKTLAEILRDPVWCTRLGLSGDEFKATWYMSNPYDLLPADLQHAIKQHPEPFPSKKHLMQWCHATKAPHVWRQAIDLALIETTARNLWRASQGLGSYAKNGEFIEPIVIDHGNNRLEVRDGHIATDPSVIPTNSMVLLVVKINGEDRVLRVKASDIGSAIRGRHVDLPIHLSQDAGKMPYTLFPKEVSNMTVKILMPIQVMARANPGQKA